MSYRVASVRYSLHIPRTHIRFMTLLFCWWVCALTRRRIVASHCHLCSNRTASNRYLILHPRAAICLHHTLLLTSYVSVRSYAFARIFSFASVLAWNIYQYSNANIQSLFALLSMRCNDVRRAMTFGIAHRAHYTIAQSCMCNHIGCSWCVSISKRTIVRDLALLTLASEGALLPNWWSNVRRGGFNGMMSPCDAIWDTHTSRATYLIAHAWLCDRVMCTVCDLNCHRTTHIIASHQQ